MGVRLYAKASLAELAKFLGFTESDMERYQKTERKDFNEGTADEKSAMLNTIETFGFGKFDLRILKAHGFSENDICGGSTKDAELAVKLLISTRFYDPIKENAFVWAAFFKRTGGVYWY